jgi:hypothetical protein
VIKRGIDMASGAPGKKSCTNLTNHWEEQQSRPIALQIRFEEAAFLAFFVAPNDERHADTFENS